MESNAKLIQQRNDFLLCLHGGGGVQSTNENGGHASLVFFNIQCHGKELFVVLSC